MSTIQVQTLHSAIAAVCPIDGVSIGDVANKLTWVIAFKAAATSPQRVAAQTVIDGYDPALLNEPSPALTANDFEVVCENALNSGDVRIDFRKLLKAKFISDLAWRLGKAPGALTALELSTERDRIAAIYKNL